MYLEFNGLPGSGKTTIANGVEGRLRQESVNVIDFKEYLLGLKNTPVRFFFLMLLLFFQGGFRAAIRYFRLYCHLKKNRKGAIKYVYNSWRNYVLCQRLIRKNPNAFIISDQCIIQNLLSCFYFEEEVGKKDVMQCFSLFQKYLESTVFIDVDLEADAAIERIQGRNTIGGRTDQLNGEQLKSLIEKQKRDLAVIRESIRRPYVITLDSMITPEENCMRILADDRVKSIR